MADNKEIALDERERLYNYLQMYVKSTKLTVPEFHITKSTNIGDNYVGLVYRVTIKDIENGEAKNIELILKTRRSADFMKTWDELNAKMFRQEILCYREVLLTFKETLKEHGEVIYRFPTLYYASVEPGNEVLMLENLSRQGFVMKNSKLMDYPHASLALRCLGEFHAYSFIMRSANPTDFDKFKQIEEVLFSRDRTESGDDIGKTFHKVIIKALEDEDKHYSERVQQFFGNMRQNMMDVTDGKAAEPFAVVNHGDFWTNNMLFKYEQEGKTPCDIRFLDFQICRYASPVLDIVYLLFCCCTQEMRSKHYNQLIDEYYETLSKFLQRFGYDSNTLFPYEVLLQHFTRFGKFAAGVAFYLVHIIAYNDDLKTLSIEGVLEERLKNDSFYRNLIKGTYKDLVDKNYI